MYSFFVVNKEVMIKKKSEIIVNIRGSFDIGSK